MKPNLKNLLAAGLIASTFGAVQADVGVNITGHDLEVSGLDNQQNYLFKLALPNGKIQSINLSDQSTVLVSPDVFGISRFSDGQYKYELIRITDPNQGNADRLSSEDLTAAPKMNSGFLTVTNGQTLGFEDEETTLDQVILDDLIVDGSACIGLDCVNGESFGFDTIRLKENNLRIKFQDTSASASFPSTDWQLTANDSSNGGQNKFSIDDIDAGTTPFTVEGNAPSHALYVDDGGRLGLGTSTPVVELHVVDGDTPTLRLEQDGSSGFTPQTWDLAGNETNFFIRDVTNGSKLPFRVRPNAPTSSIDVAASGNVGFGTTSPANNIHVTAATGNSGFQMENTATGTSWKFVNKSDNFQISEVGTPGAQFRVFSDGSMTVGDNNTTVNMDMDLNGNVTIRGTLTQNSDINVKENIMPVNTAEVLQKVMSLPISTWNYTFDDDSIQHLGPMAQDFFAQFGLGGKKDKIATLDTSGVALASIKELGTQLKDKNQTIEALQAENESLNQRLEALEKAVQSLTD